MRALAAIIVGASMLGAAGQAGKADLKAAEAAMIKADEAFNQSVAEKDMKRFLALIADEATFGGGTPNQLRGREAIGTAWSVFFQKDGPTVTWKPVKAEALADGEVGYTVGFSERRGKGPDGKISVQRGNYLTVWRKQADGSWQAVFDTGAVVP